MKTIKEIAEAALLKENKYTIKTTDFDYIKRNISVVDFIHETIFEYEEFCDENKGDLSLGFKIGKFVSDIGQAVFVYCRVLQNEMTTEDEIHFLNGVLKDEKSIFNEIKQYENS